MNVYSTGRKLVDSGVISAMDMLPETAYVKLVWTLGQTQDLDEVKNIMQTSLKGEIRRKTSQKYFLI
jgi:glutamyl-tRNA(Gln) amidotransferase subunit D